MKCRIIKENVRVKLLSFAFSLTGESHVIHFTSYDAHIITTYSIKMHVVCGLIFVFIISINRLLPFLNIISNIERNKNSGEKCKRDGDSLECC